MADTDTQELVSGDLERLFNQDMNPFLKWGLTWIFGAGLLFLIVAWFYPYETVLHAPAELNFGSQGRPELEVQVSLIELFQVNKMQVVRIAIADYPVSEYGHLEGNITTINKVPVNGRYALTVELKEGLQTNTKFNIPIGESRKGEAEIVLESERLLLRIWHKIMEA